MLFTERVAAGWAPLRSPCLLDPYPSDLSGFPHRKPAVPGVVNSCQGKMMSLLSRGT